MADHYAVPATLRSVADENLVHGKIQVFVIGGDRDRVGHFTVSTQLLLEHDPEAIANIDKVLAEQLLPLLRTAAESASPPDRIFRGAEKPSTSPSSPYPKGKAREVVGPLEGLSEGQVRGMSVLLECELKGDGAWCSSATAWPFINTGTAKSLIRLGYAERRQSSPGAVFLTFAGRRKLGRA